MGSVLQRIEWLNPEVNALHSASQDCPDCNHAQNAVGPKLYFGYDPLVGVHPKIVQERLGHASIQITLDTYSHVAPGLQQAAANRFDDIVLPKPIAESNKEVAEKFH